MFRNLFYRVHHVLGSLIYRECEREREGERRCIPFVKINKERNAKRIKIDEIIPDASPPVGMIVKRNARYRKVSDSRADIVTSVRDSDNDIIICTSSANLHEHATPSRASKTIGINARRAMFIGVIKRNAKLETRRARYILTLSEIPRKHSV